MIVKSHWKSQAAALHEQLKSVSKGAEKQLPEFRESWMAGSYHFIAEAVLDLLDEVLKAAEDKHCPSCLMAADDDGVQREHEIFCPVTPQEKKRLAGGGR